jgi:hypothetical protein
VARWGCLQWQLEVATPLCFPCRHKVLHKSWIILPVALSLPASNPCAVNNGGCEQVCVLSHRTDNDGLGYRCKCLFGFELDPDERRCVGKTPPWAAQGAGASTLTSCGWRLHCEQATGHLEGATFSMHRTVLVLWGCPSIPYVGFSLPLLFPFIYLLNFFFFFLFVVSFY